MVLSPKNDVYISFMKQVFYLDKIMGPPTPMQALYVPRSKAYNNDKLLAQISHITKVGSWSLYEKYKMKKVIFTSPQWTTLHFVVGLNKQLTRLYFIFLFSVCVAG